MIGEPDWVLTAERLGLALLLGGVIGIEREIHGKEAGLRTHMLVALGAALFTVVSYALPVILGSERSADPTRIAAQIVTGVGFLGAGTILQSRRYVHGLTTAASIWIVAAIGMAAGAGFYRGAALATVFGHVILVMLHYVEREVLRHRAGRRVIRADYPGEEDAIWVEELVRALNLQNTTWKAVRRKGGLSVDVEGHFRDADTERILRALREHGNLRDVKVSRS